MKFVTKTLRHIESKQDRNISFALCAMFFLPAINNFLNSILQKCFQINSFLLTPVTYILMAILGILFCYRYSFKLKTFFFTFIFFFFGVVLSLLLYTPIRTIIYSSPIDLVYSPVNKLFYFCFPAMGGMMILSDYDILFNKMKIWSEITISLGILCYILVFFVSGQNLQYMVFSYFMLLPICVCFAHARFNKNKIDLILGIIGSFCILMCGARGACVSLLLYFVLQEVSVFSRKVDIRVFIRFLAFIILGLIIILFYTEILKSFVFLFDKLGVNSRFIQKLLTDKFFEDSARTQISSAIWTGLKNNPLGYGIFGDRYVIGTYNYGNYTYAHNIITEFLCDFGYVGGAILLIVLFALILKSIIFSKSIQERFLIITLLPYGLFQLLFSSSYLENLVFFAILGMCYIKHNLHNQHADKDGMVTINEDM